MAGCRFIAGEVQDIRTLGDAIYCNQPVAVAGGAWCPMHQKLVYVKAGAKERREAGRGLAPTDTAN
jgi:hypothetical protein